MKTDKETLYDKLAANIEKAGYKVTKDSWVEEIGYKKPTREYWFDVVLKEENNVRYISHYWFGKDRNQIKELQFWKVNLVVQEDEYERII
jgi:hypothetical protein